LIAQVEGLDGAVREILAEQVAAREAGLRLFPDLDIQRQAAEVSNPAKAGRAARNLMGNISSLGTHPESLPKADPSIDSPAESPKWFL
jgi:hypothetical protein